MLDISYSAHNLAVFVRTDYVKDEKWLKDVENRPTVSYLILHSSLSPSNINLSL